MRQGRHNKAHSQQGKSSKNISKLKLKALVALAKLWSSLSLYHKQYPGWYDEIFYTVEYLIKGKITECQVSHFHKLNALIKNIKLFILYILHSSRLSHCHKNVLKYFTYSILGISIDICYHIVTKQLNEWLFSKVNEYQG